MNASIFRQLRRIIPSLRGHGEQQPDVSGLPAAERDAVLRNFALARSMLDGATQLRESGLNVPAMLLYREGVVLLARTFFSTRREQDIATLGPGELLDRFTASLEPQPGELAKILRDNLDEAANAPLLDSLTARAIRFRVNALSELTSRLVDLVEPKSHQERLWTRYAPLGSLVLTVLVLAGTGVHYALEPTNLAQFKPVTASSVSYDTTPEGAVDGKNYGRFGFHSDYDASPWLRIDLGRSYRLSSVKVFGRHDCCYEQSVPMTCEVSGDGEHFSPIATREEVFDQIEPWVIAARGVHARFVRIRSLRETVLVLSEIEVFGKMD